MRTAPLAALVCAIACNEPAPVTAPAGTVEHEVVEPAPPEIPADRRCGEAGSIPTALPPDVASGMVAVGDATLRSGDEVMVGTVKLHRDPGAWIGSRGSGHRGEALAILIDQAEAKGGPFGAQHELRPDSEAQLHVGPYRFDVRISAAPMEEVHVAVARNACPDYAVIERKELPLSFWVSTEAMRLQTFDMSGEMLQVGVMAMGSTPRLDISTLGWKHWFEPRPGQPIVVRARDWIVSIDEIVPGPGTTFAGAWPTTGTPRWHARARIEAFERRPEPARVAATVCGAASPQPTELPSELAAVPPVVDDLHIELGGAVKTGGLELALALGEIADLVLQLGGAEPTLPSSLMFSESTPSQYARVGTTLLRVDPSGANELRVRRLQLACPRAIQLPPITAATTVWLSTIGHSLVTVGPETSPTLTLQVYPDETSPSLSVTTEHAYYSRPLAPADVGDAFTLDDVLVEVVDVEASGNTHHEQRWITTSSIPAVHAQLRISPS